MTNGHIWVELVGDLVIARVRGEPTEVLLHELQEKILFLAKDAILFARPREELRMSQPKLSCTKLTPNLVVSNVDASLRFYENVLGFDRSMTFPEQSPFMFATVTNGPVKIFLSARSTVIKEDLRLSDLTLGGGNIMLIEVDGVDTVHTRIAPLVKVVMSLRTQSFGMREFAIEDPDGYVITFAERVAKPPRGV